ncbi:MAG: DUF4123 domain-containing protein [Byssovorax sp.]
MKSEPRRAIVAVPWGPLRGLRVVLDPGAQLKVGRAEWADLKVPHDRQMSGLHFELAWDGERCAVRDLGSVTGTLIDGEPGKKEGSVGHGGWIKAGETVFTVHAEGGAPERDDLSEAPPEQLDVPGFVGEARRREAEEARARRRDAEEALPILQAEAASGDLVAVLDSAKDARIVELLRAAVEEQQSLYDGLPGEVMSDVAPYVVRLPQGSRLLASLVGEGWGKRWGIYAVCDLPFKEIRRHFRRFLMVHDEETAERMYFRFYDPRVLAAFLDAATPAQKKTLFGEISAFLVETKDRKVRRLDRPEPERSEPC